ncbi:MAG TPA: succinate dehydrogenase assembly factor 2 [Steroidobacteraceae bacterium]|nr:succinate dehydrogenase assembly factor 2 [Steroidobacteraceae bacterium]
MTGSGQATDPEAGELGRLRWRSRRGMKELDVLLERYTRVALRTSSPGERRLFERLLALPDPELAGYLLGDEHPGEPEMLWLVRRIRDL